jgi:signal transduction histidine kinase
MKRDSLAHGSGGGKVFAGDRHRTRLAVISLAFAPVIDIACRVVGLQPALAGPRTELALACSSILSLLMALWLLQEERSSAARDASAPSALHTATVEPSGFLQFAAGVAHELNNPLMAVAGWAELAQRRGGPEPALERVLEATAAAAAAVARLQQLVDGSRELEARR